MGLRVELPRIEGVTDDAFQTHARSLWGLLYRMTGCAADADDLLQETFLRVLEKPPRDLRRAIEPWLVRVAMNLARDSLRRRRRIKYVGQWLPSPVEDADLQIASISAEGRYSMMESVSMAFLVALEALTPRQRAVLLLRDVFGYSVGETSDVLEMSMSNVKTTHHRSRRVMAAYDAERTVSTPSLCKRAEAVIAEFLDALASESPQRIEALLCQDVRETSDGGGEFVAALNPIVGAQAVARFFAGIVPDDGRSYRVEVRMLNGSPGVLVQLTSPALRQAPCMAVLPEIGDDEKIRAIRSVLASRKLTALDFSF